jgi:hypothetical protein
MITNEWKEKLKTAGIMLFSYLMVPFIVQWTLGARDNLPGGLSISTLVQAGIAVYLLYVLFGQKAALTGELKAWLDGRGQPQERTLELTGKVSSSGGYICAAALLLPPLGDMFPRSWLLTLVKFFVIVYTVFTVYGIWGLAEPYLAYTPPPEPEADPGEAPAVGRCAKCGQQLTSAMTVCAFCKHPVK